MMRERLTWLFALLVMVAAGWWLSSRTEWVEVDRAQGERGAARDNPVYAFEQLLRQLGMAVVQHEALDPLPPTRARLVLLSNDWELVPERAEALHQWVLRGGHLVLLQDLDWDDTPLARWVPVEPLEIKRPPRPASKVAGASEASAASTGSAPASLPTPSTPPAPRSKTWEMIQLSSSPPLWEGVDSLGACEFFPVGRRLRLKPGQHADWTLAQDDGAQVLRVSLGQGSVTVLNTGRLALRNVQALRCDNPLLLAAALQAQPGATAWIYLNEKREALLPWLWHSGWIAILTGLLALAAALWRSAVRFGPRLAAAPRLRRSISEQVRGLGAYLQREGREALLVAQQRALDEAAVRQLRGYGRLPVAERARAIAAAIDLPMAELATAMTTRACTRAELPQRLQWLETARRRLLAGRSATAAAPARPRGTSPASRIHDERHPQ